VDDQWRIFVGWASGAYVSSLAHDFSKDLNELIAQYGGPDRIELRAPDEGWVSYPAVRTRTLRDEWHSYKSDRGIPLVYLGPPPAPLEPGILTVENYLKWYEIYVVLPSGLVSPLPMGVLDRYHKECHGATAWRDHVPHPDYCWWIPEAYPDQYDWDSQSLDMVVGRSHNDNRR
jgi:hypothetical protein